MHKSLLLIFAVFVLGGNAQARVFDFKSGGFAIDFGGTFGASNAGNGAYGLSSGYGTQFDRQVQSATSAEFSFVFAGERGAIRFGGEYLMPHDQNGVNGTDAGGTNLFSLHSTISALIPEVNIEYYAYRGPNSHAFIGVGYGYALVSLSNQYTMTSAGQAQFGVGNYTETSTSAASLFQGYVGWEFVFTESVALAFNVGYRYLMVPNLQASESATAITGAEASGSNLLNEDSGTRALNLGGGFGGANLRFYF